MRSIVPSTGVSAFDAHARLPGAGALPPRAMPTLPAKFEGWARSTSVSTGCSDLGQRASRRQRGGRNFRRSAISVCRRCHVRQPGGGEPQPGLASQPDARPAGVEARRAGISSVLGEIGLLVRQRALVLGGLHALGLQGTGRAPNSTTAASLLGDCGCRLSERDRCGKHTARRRPLLLRPPATRRAPAVARTEHAVRGAASAPENSAPAAGRPARAHHPRPT